MQIVGIPLLVLGSGLIVAGGMCVAIPTLVAGAGVAITGAVVIGLANYGSLKNESAESSMLTANQANEGFDSSRRSEKDHLNGKANSNDSIYTQLT